MTLPFRSYLSKLGIRLAKRFKNVRCIFITFLHLQSMRVVKKVHVPFKNSLSSQKKKKKNIQRYPDTENKFTSHITNATKNLALFRTNRSNRSKDAHTRQKHDTINWFSTRVKLHRSQATRASIERYLEGHHRSCNSSNCFESTTTRARPPDTIFTVDSERTNELGRVLES